LKVTRDQAVVCLLVEDKPRGMRSLSDSSMEHRLDTDLAHEPAGYTVK
jgi:hypothetical protein